MSFQLCRTLAIALAVMGFAASQSFGQTFTTPRTSVINFGGNGTGWTLNGGATVAADDLTLTNDIGGQARTAYRSIPVSLNGDFSLSFDYKPTYAGQPADGFGIVFQNQGTGAVGGGGGYIGYLGISPSRAIGFNLYNGTAGGASDIRSSVLSNGNDPTVVGVTNTSPVDITQSGVTTNVQLTYTAATQSLSAKLTQGANTFTQNYSNIDLAGSLGTSAFFGFSGGTGGASAAQDIKNLTYTSTAAPQTSVSGGLTVNAATTNTYNVDFDAGNARMAVGQVAMNANSVFAAQASGASPNNQPYTLLTGPVTLNGAATFNVANNGSGLGTLVLDGAVSGSGTLTKGGPGTLDLRAVSSNNGGTIINAGKVLATAPGTLGTGAVTLNNGGALTIAARSSATISGFGTDGAGWTLNGGAGINNGTFTATQQQQGSQARTGFLQTPIPTNANFTLGFTYQADLGSGTPADGLSVIFQTSPSGNTVLGGGGGGLGYAGITNSTALGFNLYTGSPGGKGISSALATGGGATSPYVSTGSVDLLGATPINVTLAYNQGAGTLTATLTQGVNTFTKTYSGVTFPAGNEAFLGFGGGTGGETARQRLTNFSFATSAVPSTTYTNDLSVTAAATGGLNVLATAASNNFSMGNLTLNSGSTLNVAAETGSAANQPYTLTFTSGIAANGGTLNVANNGVGLGNVVATGNVTGSGGLTKTGAGTLTLSSAGGINEALLGPNLLPPTTVTTLGSGHLIASTGTTYNLKAGTLDFQDYAAGGSNHNPTNRSVIQLNTGGAGGAFNFTGGTLKDVSIIQTANSTGTFLQNTNDGASRFVVGQDKIGPGATTTINGAYNLAAGVLALDVFGIDPNNNERYSLNSPNDRLDVNGAVTLNGQLEVNFLNSTANYPLLHQSWNVVNSSLTNGITLGANFSVPGAYYRLVGNNGGPGQTLQVFVPEPGTIAIWSLLGLAGAGFAWRKARKTK